MSLSLSPQQLSDIDDTVDLIFTCVGRMNRAPLGRRRVTVNKARHALHEWTQHCGDGGPRDHRKDVTDGGLGGLFFTAESYFLAFDVRRHDPDGLTKLGREQVVEGMRAAAVHYEQARELAQVMAAQEKGMYITLIDMVRAGLTLEKLAKKDPQMGVVGPGIAAYHRAVWEGDGGGFGPVIETLNEMLDLATQDDELVGA